jgi:hypothetical protein
MTNNMGVAAMTKNTSFRGLTAAALAVSALFAAQPAAADIIEINNFWAGSGVATINFTGTNWLTGQKVSGLQESGGSGGFKTYDLTTDPNKQNAFQSFCVNIFNSFSFSVDSNDKQQPATIISTSAAADLGQLYTNHHAEIDSTSSSAENEAAFQLAVWEIVNEQSQGDTSYDLNAGTFKASGTGSSLAQSWLSELYGANTTSEYAANIWTVQSMITTGHGYAQDLVTFSPIQTPVPEPETYAMMLVGLGLLGFSARRKNQNFV